MKKMESNVFRRTYTKLKEPTVITAYGRPIGVWTPYSEELRKQYLVDKPDTVDELKDLNKETTS